MLSACSYVYVDKFTACVENIRDRDRAALEFTVTVSPISNCDVYIQICKMHQGY